MATIVEEHAARMEKILRENARHEHATFPVILICAGGCGWSWKGKVDVKRTDGGPWTPQTHEHKPGITYMPGMNLRGVKWCTACDKVRSADYHMATAAKLRREAQAIWDRRNKRKGKEKP